MNPTLSCPELLSQHLNWEVRLHPSATLTWMCVPQVTASSQQFGFAASKFGQQSSKGFLTLPRASLL